MKTPEIIVVVGPTASGKSELAVKLAKKYNGEIISADSRQVYRGLDIGSGKVTGKWTALPVTSHHGSKPRHSGAGNWRSLAGYPGSITQNPGKPFRHPERSEGSHKQAASTGSQKQVLIYKNIPHYLIDEASPRVQYSAARFQINARKVIKGILKRGKLPIICGGTMHWIDALVYNQQFPEVKPNRELRTKLSRISPEQLHQMLLKKDPERARTIDAKNPHRLIRALEIFETTGKPVPKLIQTSEYDSLWVGLNPQIEILEQKISKRLKQRLKQGLLEEVQTLRNSGLSWEKLEDFGLEYKYCALYLQGKLSRTEMEEQLFIAIRQYAKRQMTWWKRNKNIRWFADASEVTSKLNSIFS